MMLRPLILTVAATLLPPAPTAAGAQESPLVAAGERVRVWRSGAGTAPVEGVVSFADGDSLVVAYAANQRLAARWSELQALQARRYGQTRVEKGALYGGLGGALAGAAFGLGISDSDCEFDFKSCYKPSTGITVGFLAGGILGAGAGAVFGAFMGGKERWVSVALK